VFQAAKVQIRPARVVQGLGWSTLSPRTSASHLTKNTRHIGGGSLYIGSLYSARNFF
jgi:hypothetical protein